MNGHSWVLKAVMGILGTSLIASISWGYGVGNRLSIAEEKIANINIWLDRIEGKLDRTLRRTEWQWGKGGKEVRE